MLTKFDDITGLIHSEAVDGFDLSASQLRKNILAAVRKVNNEFFAVLTQKMVGRQSNTIGLGSYSVKWPRLTPSYVRWKRRHGSKNPTGFFEHTGGLREALIKRDTQKTFGAPRIFRRHGGFKGVPGTIAIQDKKDRLGARSATGKFANPADIYRKVSDLLVVDPFPKTSNLSEYEIAVLFPSAIGKKLTAYRGDIRRPFIGSFMSWWIDMRIRQAIDKAIR